MQNKNIEGMLVAVLIKNYWYKGFDKMLLNLLTHYSLTNT